MKNFIKIAFVAILTIGMAGCKGHKEMGYQNSLNQQKPINLNECMKMQEEKPAIRQYGQGTAFDFSFARKLAEDDARASYGAALKTKIESVVKSYNKNHQGYASNGKKGAIANDQIKIDEGAVTNIVDVEVKNTYVIHTQIFEKKDGQKEVWVCIEYRGSDDALADKIAREYQQQLSDEEKLKMDFQFEKFKEEMKKELEDYRANQK